ncbi:MAG: phosphomannomutase [Planctomycetaceae bacterium]|jgi:phosphomannomutase|nr:phosphomannomutase [Planctomycetaceae bacterium]
MEIQINQLMTDSGVGFGTSGARGLVADMTDTVCFAYTLAFLQYTAQTCGKTFDRAAVAYDLRTSSPRIAQAVRTAVAHFGLTPVDCGTVPSPTVALYGLTEKIPSIMVTGSHIPEDRNGIKFNLPTGEILKKDEEGIRQQTVDVPDDFGKLLAAAHSECAARSEAEQLYIDRFVRALPKNFLAGCRIGLYEHSAVGRDVLYNLYTTLGAAVTRLGRSGVFVAVDTEAVRDEDLSLAKNWANGNDLPQGVRGDSENPPFDAVLSTDGDSDRPLIFDEHGGWIRGDIAGILTARFLLADCIVTPVSSNTALEKSGWFKNIVRTKIGSPYVIEAMQSAVKQGFRRVAGYEANGGFLTANDILLDEEESRRPLDALPTRDPAVVHIAVLSQAKALGVPLSEITGYLPRRIVMSDRLQNFPVEISRQKMAELLSESEERIQLIFASFGELQRIDRTDGLRMTFGDQDIIHIRPSGNAPELRCYTESDTKERTAALLYRTMTLLDSWRRREQRNEYPYLQ